VVEIITQPIKPTRMPLRYPCIICSSFEHYAPNCFIKTNVQNMFWTKPTIITNVITKNPKIDHVLINVVNVVMTCSQVLKSSTSS
jgi:hypothetical protein